MANEILTSQEILTSINQILQTSFWKKPEFWISSVVGLSGVGFSWAAFVQAGKAKRAAIEAGKTVKLQTITIELTEILHMLELQQDIRFSEARDKLTEISRRLHRNVSPFLKDPALVQTIRALLDALAKAKDSLNNVRPTNPDADRENVVPFAVYYGIQGDFATISDMVADLLGLFENKTIKFGEEEHAGK